MSLGVVTSGACAAGGDPTCSGSVTHSGRNKACTEAGRLAGRGPRPKTSALPKPGWATVPGTQNLGPHETLRKLVTKAKAEAEKDQRSPEELSVKQSGLRGSYGIEQELANLGCLAKFGRLRMFFIV